MMTPEEFIKSVENPVAKDPAPKQQEDGILVPYDTLQFVKDALQSAYTQPNAELYPSVIAGLQQAIEKLKPYLGG